MKRMSIAFALIASASAAPAFADTPLTGTVVSTMGDAATVALTPKESGIGDDGLVMATAGSETVLPKERVLPQREQARVSGDLVTAYTFPSTQSAVTSYGAR
jgi:hypothetical protein